MYIKLVKSLLASTLLLIGMNGTAIGGECETVLERMQNILEERKGGDNAAGIVPESLIHLPPDKNISIYEDGDTPEKIEKKGIGYCFKFSGRWSKDTRAFKKISSDTFEHNFPPIIAYVFFKSPSSDGIKNNLEIDSSYEEDKSGNRVIALTAKHREDDQTAIAGAISNDKPENIKEKIIWLPVDSQKGQNKSIEVVLCEGPCRDILGSSNIDKTNDVPMDPDGQAVTKSPTGGDLDGTEERVIPVCTKPKSSDKDQKEIKYQHQNEIKKLKKECKNKRQKIEKNAITKFINSRIDFQFKDMNGNEVKKLKRNNLKPKECNSPKITTQHTLKKSLRVHYKKCYSIPDFDILEAKPTIKNNTLTIIYKLKKSTPAKIKHIEISVRMEDESKVTISCALQAKIFDSSTNTLLRDLAFTFDSHKQKLSLEINEPIAWKGKVLVLEKGEETDCQPKDGKLRIEMKEKDITKDAVLKIPKTTLYSTLGNALIVLNTMIGMEASNEVKSSTQFYPIANDQDSKELFIEMVTQILLQLDGKYKDLIIGYREKNGKLKFKDFTSQLENHPKKETAQIIVDFVNFTGNEFNWDTMIRAVNKDTHNRSEYAYRVFIGQSGLSNDKSYCENIPSKQEPLNQDVATYIYDFASDDNDYNPLLKDLKSVDRKFPLLNCPVSNNISVHVVLFPQSKKSGWDKNISTLFSNAFKDR